MTTKEFIEKHFLHIYRQDNVKGIDRYSFIKSESDEQAPINVKSPYLEGEDKYFVIRCNKGHLIKASEADMDDLISKGCPFCKSHRGSNDWQRHIDYSVELDSLGFASEQLKSVFLKYREISLTRIKDNEIEWSVYSIPIEKLDLVFDGKSRINTRDNEEVTDFTKISKLAHIVNELWHEFTRNRVRIKNLIAIFDNNKHLLNQYKPKENEWFITKCKKCGEVNLFSALRVELDNGKCKGCGEELLPHKKWFNYSYEKYLEQPEGGFTLNEYIRINPHYCRKLEDLGRAWKET